MKTFFREFLGTIILAAIIFFVLQATVQSFIVVGISMEPSFHGGQRLLVNKAVYYLHEPERGDVIVFQPPENKQEDYIKRVIALPGDTVEVKDKKVYVNGSPLNETYIKASPSYTAKEQKVPANSYFVLGDNRNNSNDSHNGWFAPRQNIVGKVWISLWPSGKLGFVLDYHLLNSVVSASNE